VLLARRDVGRAAGHHPRPRVPPQHGVRRGDGQPVGGCGARAEHRVVGGHLGHLHPQHEAHRVEEGHQPARGGGLGDQPRGRAVVHQRHRVLDVPVRVQEQHLARLPWRQSEQRLRGERVQPGEPVRPAHHRHAQVGEVDDGAARGERPLLADGVAVVEGHAGVRRDADDGARPGQQRAAVGHDAPGREPASAESSCRARRADA